MTVTPVTVHGLTTVAAQDTVRRYVFDVLAQDANANSRPGSAI